MMYKLINNYIYWSRDEGPVINVSTIIRWAKVIGGLFIKTGQQSYKSLMSSWSRLVNYQVTLFTLIIYNFMDF